MTIPSQKRIYLTKSGFKLAWDCARKLVYSKDKRYQDLRVDNDFLKLLADGGFQVGELAKFVFGPGIEIESAGHDDAERATRDSFASKENVTVFEAALRYEQLFVRVDVLQVTGEILHVIEVKAKKEPEPDKWFMTHKKKPAIRSEWLDYLVDVAFQTYVARKLFPDRTVRASLALLSRDCLVNVDGMNQLFPIVTDKRGRSKCEPIPGLSLDQLDPRVLVAHDVTAIVDQILEDPEIQFHENLERALDALNQPDTVWPSVTQQCRDCEFFPRGAQVNPEKINGGALCWTKQFGGVASDFETKPLSIELWDSRYVKLKQKLENGPFLITIGDLEPPLGTSILTDTDGALSKTQRQQLQIEASRAGAATQRRYGGPFTLLRSALKAEMQTWSYPLHFIDFETCAPALPFFQDCGTYDSVAFQFSHHVLHEDGRLVHQSEFLNAKPGVHPSGEFLLNLKAAIGDTGTVFCYAAHENTTLTQILRLIQIRPSLVGGAEIVRDLVPWTRRLITDGDRQMVDLLKLVKRVYYSPTMGASNSIKVVLPAVLTDSPKLRDVYSKPIYGSDLRPSLNFQNWTLVAMDENGVVVDPYKRLSSDDLNNESRITPAELFALDETETADVNNGTAAMAAYNALQFAQCSPQTRHSIESALKRYCELDTLSMALIVEFFLSEV